MSPPPKWLESLRKELRAPDAPAHAFTPEQAEAKRAEFLRALPEGVAREPPPLPVAEGPSAVDRLGHKSPCWLLLDPSSPDELKVALTAASPSSLWLGAGQTAASLKSTLAPYFPAHVPDEGTLGRTVRGFLGTGGSGKLDLYQLHDRVKASPFVDELAWGSAFAKDPFPDVLKDKGAAAQETARHFRAQAPGSRPSFSFRTRFSKSVLRAEAHVEVWPGVDLYVGQLRYAPASQGSLLRSLNARLGTKYPEDLPVDLAGALMGLRFDPPDVIRDALQRQSAPEHITFGLLCLDCLASDPAAAERDLRPFAAHADLGVRQLVANLALRHGFKALLTEMAQRERHPELKSQLSASAQRLA